jgi:restriction system protein
MWEYKEVSRIMTIVSVYSDHCIYCQSALLHLPAEKFEVKEKRLLMQISICLQCGWWSLYRIHQGEYRRTAGIIESHSGAIGCLKELDLTDISTPLDEVRQYFLAKKESIYQAHPRLFEDVVSSVFKSFWWKTRVTAYSGDDGIDVILDGKCDCTVGVQVKRYKKERKIEAEQIRSLAGALVLGGHTEGIFVTTSSFRRGAIKTAKEFNGIGHPITLIDAKKFLEALGIAQYKSFELDREKILSYVTKKSEHLGSGLEKEFVPREDLRKRPIVGRIQTSGEFWALHGDQIIKTTEH